MTKRKPNKIVGWMPSGIFDSELRQHICYIESSKSIDKRGEYVNFNEHVTILRTADYNALIEEAASQLSEHRECNGCSNFGDGVFTCILTIKQCKAYWKRHLRNVTAKAREKNR